MFVTEATSRFQYQFDPLRTLWRAVEVDEGTSVFVAHIAAREGCATRTFLISTPDALSDALSGKCFGTVDQLCRVDGVSGTQILRWRLQPVREVLRHRLDVLGGVDALEAVLKNGRRYWISPVLQQHIRQPFEVIWEWPSPTGPTKARGP